MNETKRVVFLDYSRVLACLMVMFVHACELYYFGADGGLRIETAGDAVWVTAIDSLCRMAVPLFVMASAYLLFPLTRPTGEFFRRRFMRVVVPFLLWSAVYIWKDGSSPIAALFNFPMGTGGHLWFVPMLLGVYLLMPLLSPWAERAGRREVQGWLFVWLFTLTFPFVRKACEITCGAPSFGAIPYLYGECAWNPFGMFHYVSGFFGYLLLGFYFRRFVPELSWKRALAVGMPMLLVGYAVTALGFALRIPGNGTYPATASYEDVVDLEMSWMYCSSGVALMVAGGFLLMRKVAFAGGFYARVIRPLSETSYGTYLMHMLILVVLGGHLKGTVSTPAAIVLIAIGSFAISSVASLLLRKIPVLGKCLVG